MAYATVSDVQQRLTRTMSPSEQTVCATLLDDAAVIIDAYRKGASADAKKVVSCRMVIRTLEEDSDVPIGATQGSMSALSYSQSWTISGGASGELYLSNIDKQTLGKSNSIGSYSPSEELVPEVTE